MRLNQFGWFVVVVVAVALVIMAFTGCGNRGRVAQAPVRAQNFAWGECPSHYHAERCSNPLENGYFECECVADPCLNDPGGCP